MDSALRRCTGGATRIIGRQQHGRRAAPQAMAVLGAEGEGRATDALEDEEACGLAVML